MVARRTRRPTYSTVVEAVVKLWVNAGERRFLSVLGGERLSPSLHDRCGWTRGNVAYTRVHLKIKTLI